MQGVFLHVMADTLGSVGVIISTLLIQWFGWTGFDPLASIAIASLIFASVVPLVRDSMHMLLLRLPDDAQAGVQVSIDQIYMQVGGIAAISRAQFWPVTETRIMGVVHVKVDPNYVLDKEEHSLCAITMRDVASSAISEICRSNIPGLRDVFVHIDDAASTD
ncbi:putative serine/threonine protein phosphatase [Coemansia pectinata]|uniref:Serine/threonine protein phosphatase n=1 Tax=Coemansia pectinata TaxID=1052879 RepID=A0A9W8GNW9_9FUNG|nr:putative serine/threonine protein phosphatase [Coemansia pectinata]